VYTPTYETRGLKVIFVFLNNLFHDYDRILFVIEVTLLPCFSYNVRTVHFITNKKFC